VRTPDGRVVVDPTGKMDGRGAYVCNSEECRRVAFDKGSLERALGVPIPTELRAQLTGEASTILPASVLPPGILPARTEEGDSGGQE
jgi:predicted RNA-binding protein YlxR (DUF448 family)